MRAVPRPRGAVSVVLNVTVDNLRPLDSSRFLRRADPTAYRELVAGKTLPNAW